MNNHTIKYKGVNIEDLSKKRLVELLKEAVLRLKVYEAKYGAITKEQISEYAKEEIRADKP